MASTCLGLPDRSMRSSAVDERDSLRCEARVRSKWAKRFRGQTTAWQLLLRPVASAVSECTRSHLRPSLPTAGDCPGVQLVRRIDTGQRFVPIDRLSPFRFRVRVRLRSRPHLFGSSLIRDSTTSRWLSATTLQACWTLVIPAAGFTGLSVPYQPPL